MSVPRHAQFLTIAGMLPFIAGAILRLSPEPSVPAGQYALIYPTDAIAMLAAYGVIILCFMSGVLWGLAANRSAGAVPFVLSVLPAIAAFFLCTQHLIGAPSHTDALFWLMLGFPAVLVLDFVFARTGLTPTWWMRLRIPPTIVATLACGIGWYI